MAAVLELCDVATAGGSFVGELSRRLGRLIPFDASLFIATDPATVLPTPPVRVEHLDEDCQTFWERELMVEDILLYRDLARRSTPAGTIRTATAGHPERSTRHRQLNLRHGFDDELRVVFRTGSRAWGVASLWRARGRPHFSEDEMAVVADLAPAVGRAFRAMTLERNPHPSDGRRGPGLLMFGPACSLESLNEEAALWLGELERRPEDGHERGVPIPTEVYSVLSQARAVAAGRASAPARTRLRSRTGRWLVLHGSCLREGDGRLGGTAVVIEPAQPAEIVPIIVEAYELTDREREVTALIARGLGTAEIADTLYLSRHTVRDHVKSVLDKIGVGSRVELLARLFGDHYYQRLHA